MLMGPFTTRLFPSDRCGLLISSVMGIIPCVLMLIFGLMESPVVRAIGVGVALALCIAGIGIVRSFALALTSKIVPARLRERSSMGAIASMTIGRGVGALVAVGLDLRAFAYTLMVGFGAVAALCFMCFRQLEVTEGGSESNSGESSEESEEDVE